MRNRPATDLLTTNPNLPVKDVPQRQEGVVDVPRVQRSAVVAAQELRNRGDCAGDGAVCEHDTLGVSCSLLCLCERACTSVRVVFTRLVHDNYMDVWVCKHGLVCVFIAQLTRSIQQQRTCRATCVQDGSNVLLGGQDSVPGVGCAQLQQLRPAQHALYSSISQALR